MRILFLADSILASPDSNTLREMHPLLREPSDFFRSVYQLLPHEALAAPAILGTILKKKGHDVKVFEAAASPYRFKKLVAQLRAAPHVVCISTTFISSAMVLKKLIGIVRKYSGSSKIILGGPSLYEETEMRPLGDYYILGEGEVSLPLLIEKIQSNSENIDVHGVGYKKGEIFLENPQGPPFALSETVAPDWSLLDRAPEEYYILATQKGCAFRCSFCTYPAKEGYKLRFRETPDVIQEIVQNFERFGINKYFFSDATFTEPVERCIDILTAISRLPFKIEWMGYARVDSIVPALSEILSKSGCRGLFFGLESGSDMILKKMNKGFSRNQMVEGIRALDDTGIIRTGSWIFGFPGETADSAQCTIDLILDLKCELNAINIFALRGMAPVGVRPEKFKVSGNKTKWNHLTMTNQEAWNWVDLAIRECLKNQVGLGGVLDLIRYATVGWSIERAHNLVQKVQRLYASEKGILRLPNHEEVILDHQISLELNELKERALSHKLWAQ